MQTDNIDKLLIAICDFIESSKEDTEIDADKKYDLLLQAKTINRLTKLAIKEASAINDDQQDELSLRFGEQFFNIFRSNNDTSGTIQRVNKTE